MSDAASTVADVAVTGYDVRARLEDLLVRDLHGPWDGETEELLQGTTPGERYLLGKLVPRRSEVEEPVVDGAETADDDVENRPELVDDGGVDLDPDDPGARVPPAAVRSRAMAASSIGFAFAVPPDVERLVVDASWGRYERGPSEQGQDTPTGRPAVVWHRVPAGGTVEIDLTSNGDAVPDPHQDGVIVRWRVRVRDGRRVVEVFLLNGQAVLTETPDVHRLFQVRMSATALDGHASVFLGHNDPELSELRRENDPELRRLALLHRRQRLYGTGRLCAVDADVRDGEKRAWRLTTTCFPAAEVERVVPGNPAEMPGVELDMARLGSFDLDPSDLERGLRPLASGYRRWLATQAERLAVDAELQRFSDVTQQALTEANAVADRLDRAVDLLRDDPRAREAFRFANQAMARQRVRSELVHRRAANPGLDVRAALRELDRPNNRSWRPFQLAFVLLCLPGLTDHRHPDAARGPLLDGEAQLLFFPTGGGKTEAYLGLTAYTLAIRRLQGQVGTGSEARDGTDGVAVIMRYTLRLLTAQQFQRATALICACELLRQERIAADDLRWGSKPLRIGLWVGSAVTPNSVDEARARIEDAAGRAGEGQVGGVLQFASCPWCGSPLDLGRDAHFERTTRRIHLYCGDPDGRCSFSRAQSDEGLPALVVDEEIYRLTPSLLIGTVDKFASLPWDGATAHLFGHVTTWCDRHGYRPPDTPAWCRDGGHPAVGAHGRTTPVPAPRLRPPDLIIQDELHLISDALGSMVGLYETVVDRLATRHESGVPIRPVLVASTATVRRAAAQVAQVFARRLTVFPPPLLDAGDTFFSRRVPADADNPGRRYRGVLAPGERLTAIEIRVMTALLEFGQLLLDEHGEAADPYLTVVDYFTSTRELAGMRRLTEDDVTDRLGRQAAVARRRTPLAVAELTSRMDSRKITQSLADVGKRFSADHDSSAARSALSQLRRADRAAYEQSARPLGQRPLDVLLATSMLQVGVDVPRLGLMVVTGQPKNMAEYIQASSRVGRSAAGPGLVLALYQWNRPRDLAHYEHFGYDHQTFGRRVEGLTTTPFSSRAIDRGLTAVLAAAVRHGTDAALPNLGANSATLDGLTMAPLLRELHDRAELVAESPQVGQDAQDGAQHRLDDWQRIRVTLPGGQLGYRTDTRAARALLRDPDEDWTLWTTPRSLRDVEPEVLLQLRRDDPTWEAAPTWTFGSPAPTEDEETG